MTRIIDGHRGLGRRYGDLGTRASENAVVAVEDLAITARQYDKGHGGSVRLEADTR